MAWCWSQEKHPAEPFLVQRRPRPLLHLMPLHNFPLEFGKQAKALPEPGQNTADVWKQDSVSARLETSAGGAVFLEKGG